MIQNNPTNVSAAFEMLLEEVEAEIEFVNGIGSKAFGDSDYDRAKEALEQAATITAFRDRVAGLRDEWLATFEEQGAEEEDEETRAQRRNLGRLKRGLRTTEKEFRRPLLRALVKLGGSAEIGAVLDGLKRSMKDILADVDYEPLASDPNMLRWRNTAQWTRHILVKQGLMKGDSKRGIWEISERGRKALAESDV